MEQVKKELPDYVKRMQVELSELTEKIDKLSLFLRTPKMLELSELKQKLLKMQFEAMQVYAEMLNERLDLILNEHQAL